jgi:hypothetical protein
MKRTRKNRRTTRTRDPAARVPLDSGSHINAGAHLPPEAAATQECRLEAVRCSAVILIQASSSVLYGGKVAYPKFTPQGGDLDELLYAAA